MNQIYACRKGREIPFTGTTRINTTAPATRSDGRNLIVKLLMGVFVFLVFGATQSMGQTRTYNVGLGQTFIVPPGVTSMTFDVTGAGGGGAGAVPASGVGSGGGGGGSFQRYTCTVLPGQTLTINVGAGGTGGAGAAGNPGGITTVTGAGISCAISHAGGAGGANNTGGNGDVPGSGNSGGNGGDGEIDIPGNFAAGGGGGGAASLALNGTNGSIGAANVGGAGGSLNGGAGADGVAGTPNGNPATGPGGGGGGGARGDAGATTGGTGGDGRLVVSYTCPTYFLPVIGTVTSTATIGAFCAGGAAQSVTGPGTLPAGTAALAGLSPNFYTLLGPTLSGTNVTGDLTIGFSYTPTTAGCFVISYSYLDPNPLAAPCQANPYTATRTVLVYPVNPTLTAGVNVCAGSNLTQPGGTPALPVGFKYQWHITRCAAPNVVVANWVDVFPAIPTAGIYSIKVRIVTDGLCGGVPADIVSPVAACQESLPIVGRVFPAVSSLTALANVCAGTNLPQPTGPAAAPPGFKVQWFVERCNFPGAAVLVANWTDAFPVTSVAGTYRIKSRYVTDGTCFGDAANTVAPGGCLETAFVNENIFPAAPVITAVGNVCAGTSLPTPTGVAAPPPGFKVQWIVQLCGAGAAVWTDAPFPVINTAGVYAVAARYVTDGNCFGVAADILAPAACFTSNIVYQIIFPNPLSVIVEPANVCFGGALAMPTGMAAAPFGFKIQWSIDGAAFADAFVGPTTVGCHSFKARYVTDGNCAPVLAGIVPPLACAETNTVSALVYPTPVITPAIVPTCSPTGFSPVMQNNAANVAAGFTAQFSNNGAAGPWYTGASPVTNTGCYTVVGRWVNTALCGVTAPGTPGPGPCDMSAPSNVIIYPQAPAISNPTSTCSPTTFVLPSVPDYSPDFRTEWNIGGAGFAFNPVMPTAPGVYTLQARYVNTAFCGTIAPLTAGPACTFTNIVNATIISTPVLNAVISPAPVCCGTMLGGFNFGLANAMVPAGTTVISWTNSNPAIGLAANGVGNIAAFAAACNPTTQFATITVTATHTVGLVTCTSAPMVFNITVWANTQGVIEVPANTTICHGQNGGVNVTLTGTPTFNGVFRIFNNTTATFGANLGWSSALLGGPQNIVIPTANIPNTTNTPITYTISWFSLSDANCVSTLMSGATNITVNPLPVITVTRSGGAGPLCPNGSVVYTVNLAPGNTVPSTYNYTIVATPSTATSIAAGYPFSGSNVAYGALPATPLPACPYNGTITFTATPFANLAPNCQGPTVQDVVTVQDITPPVVVAFGDGGTGTFTVDRCNTLAISNARGFIPSGTNTNCPGSGAPTTAVLVAEAFTPSCFYTAGYAAGKTGTFTTTYRITEPCGAVLDVVKTVIVNDVTLPFFSTAAGNGVVLPAGNLNRTVQYCDNTALANAQALVPFFSDGCAYGAFAGAPAGTGTVVKVAGVFAVGACPTTGTITNTFTVTDPCGNVSATYTQQINIIDLVGPVINNGAVIPNQTINTGGPGCTALLPNYVATLPIPVTDCVPAANPLFPANPVITYSQAAGPGLTTGPNTVSQWPAPLITVSGPAGTIIPINITAQDACGNTSTSVFNVTLFDGVAPNAVCRTLNNTTQGLVNSRVELGAGGTASITASAAGTVQNTNNGSNDNCGGVLTFSYTVMGFVGGLPTNVNPTRVYTCADITPAGAQSAVVPTTMWVMDQYGNQSSCVANVTVIDLLQPNFTNCPANNALALVRDGGCGVTIPNYMANSTFPALGVAINATDNCGPVTYTQNPAPGSFYGAGFPIVSNGTYVDVVITATDAKGNTRDCVFRVRLLDQTAPAMTCPADQLNIPAGAGSCSAVVTWTVPTATDNCAPANNQGPITYTAAATGNNTNPNITGGTYIVPGSVVNAIFFVGSTNVTYTASDNAVPTPNIRTCTFTVTVIDNTLPVITNCSAPLTTTKNVSTGVANCVYTHAGTAWDITATDNCLLAITPYAYNLSGATTTVGFVASNSLNGVVFNRGTTTVLWRVTDFSGNIATCTFQVIVTDAVPPVFNGPNAGGCVANQTVVANTAGCVWTYPVGSTILQVNATDNCGIVNVGVLQAFEWDISGASPFASGSLAVPLSGTPTNGTWGIPTGTVFQVGVTNVQYRIRDAQNNIVTCTFTVTVQNNVTGTIQVGTPPAANTTVSQNGATTSTVTFTGSGSGAAPGAQQYRFFYSFSSTGPGGPFVPGALSPVTTGIGSNITTVAQSNAALGNFSYRLDQVQDLTTGCMSPAGLNLIATITVVVGSDLTVQWTALGGLSFPVAGNTNDFTLSLVNIGATPSTGPIIIRIPRTSGFTLALNGVFNNANWTLTNPGAPLGFWVLTSDGTVVAPAGGTSTIGIRATRAAGVAANTSQAQTATIQAGTGGDATPGNNTSSIQLTAQ